MRTVVAAIEAEYRRYERLGDRVLDQLDGSGLTYQPSRESNSVATIVWHIAGNLASRFTDFLTTDGEKPWRDREGEFAVRDETPAAVRDEWRRGWAVLWATLADLADEDLERAITIRGVEMTALEALERSLAHTSYHVGQMTYIGKVVCGGEWSYLTIPPGGTAAYNEDPVNERPPTDSAGARE